MSTLKAVVYCAVCLLLTAALVLPVQASGYPCKGKLTGDNVRIRAGASTNHTIITQASTGDILMVYGETGEWYQVSIPDSALVWIFAKHVTLNGASATVAADKVNVRSKPEDGEVLGQLTKGDSVIVVASKDGWLQIRPHEKLRGYISSKYVELISTPELPDQDYAPVPPARDPKPYPSNEPGIDVEKQPKADADPVDVSKIPSDLAEKFSYDIEEEIDDCTRQLNIAIKAGNIQDAEQFLAKIKELRNTMESPEYQEYLKRRGLALRLVEETERILRETSAAMEALRKQHRMTLYIAEGLVYDVAPTMLSAPPGKFKLKQGNYVLFYLKKGPNCTTDLEDYLYKKVGIIGTVKPPVEGWGDIPVLEIDEIEVID